MPDKLFLIWFLDIHMNIAWTWLIHKWRGKMMHFHCNARRQRKKKMTIWTVRFIQLTGEPYECEKQSQTFPLPAFMTHAESVAQAGGRGALAVRLRVGLLTAAAGCSLSSWSGPGCLPPTWRRWSSSAFAWCLSTHWWRAAYQCRDALQKGKLIPRSAKVF